MAKTDKKIIDLAIKRLQFCVDAERENRNAAIEDLKFINGEQWDEGERQRRADKGRPALQINLLPKFVDQVVGDMLHNQPSIKIRPVDSKGDVNIAKIRQGIINNIEYLSNSPAIYGYAAKQQISSGYGAWRVLTRYTDENPFLQEAYLESIRNPFLVYLDPLSKDQNYADAKYGFVLEKVQKDRFKERFPKAKDPSGIDLGDGITDELWWSEDHVTIAEYFSVEPESVTMHQLETGEVVSEEKYREMVEEWEEENDDIIKSLAPPKPQLPSQTPPPAIPTGAPMGNQPPLPSGGPQPSPNQPPMAPPSPVAQPQQSPPMAGLPQGAPPQGAPPMAGPPQGEDNEEANRIEKLGTRPKIAKTRVTEKNIIRHRIITALEILDGGMEGNLFPGKFIPLVMVKGKELNIEGKNFVFSLVRHAKDPQKMINYWNTAAAETIALAPKAPWLGTAKQFEGYEEDYAKANVENYPMLKYNPDPEAPGPPQRQMPGQPPTAIFEQIRRGEENLKSVIGMFNADVGAPDSRQTGAAVLAGQTPGDIGTYEFMVNLSRAVLHTGRILNEMIPEVYDTERDIRIRNMDESETFAPINTTLLNAYKSISKKPEAYSGFDPNAIKNMIKTEGDDAKFNDITEGKYDVVVTTGPSYATQRAESAQHLMQLTQAMPQQMAIASDVIVRNLDFKDADEIADRLRKTLPPGIAKPLPGEPPPPPPQPDPQMMLAQAKMQSEQTKLQIAQMKMQNEKAKLEIEAMKAKAEMLKIQIEMQRDAQGNGPDPVDSAERRVKLGIEKDRLTLEQQRLSHQIGKDRAEMTHKDKALAAKVLTDLRKNSASGKM